MGNGWTNHGRAVAGLSLALSSAVILLCGVALPILHRKLAGITGDVQKGMFEFKELTDITWDAILELRKVSESRTIRSPDTFRAGLASHGRPPSRDVSAFSAYNGPKLNLPTASNLGNVHRVRPSSNGGYPKQPDSSPMNYGGGQQSYSGGGSGSSKGDGNTYGAALAAKAEKGGYGQSGGSNWRSGGPGRGGEVPANSCGCPAISCPEGPMGLPGLEGQSGTPGPDGRPGDDGFPGEDADPNSFGDNCLICPPGAPGEAGLPGRPGMPGRVGKQGWIGPRGQVGMMGDVGLRGDIGPRGDPGEDGKSGQDGKEGLGGKGPPGKVGNPGPAGSAGKQGTPGKPSFEIGRTGPMGSKGMSGQPGSAGTDGMNGQPGPGGFPGKDRHYCNCNEVRENQHIDIVIEDSDDDSDSSDDDSDSSDDDSDSSDDDSDKRYGAVVIKAKSAAVNLVESATDLEKTLFESNSTQTLNNKTILDGSNFGLNETDEIDLAIVELDDVVDVAANDSSLGNSSEILNNTAIDVSELNIVPSLIIDEEDAGKELNIVPAIDEEDTGNMTLGNSSEALGAADTTSIELQNPGNDSSAEILINNSSELINTTSFTTGNSKSMLSKLTEGLKKKVREIFGDRKRRQRNKKKHRNSN